VSVPGAVGTPRATLLYCGPQDLFDEHRHTLSALGRTEWRSEDPAMIVPFSVATLSFAMVTGVAYVYGAALAEAQGLALDDYTAVTTACMPLVEELMADAHAVLPPGTYEPGQASVNSYGNAIVHLHHEAEDAGISAELPAALASSSGTRATQAPAIWSGTRSSMPSVTHRRHRLRESLVRPPA
jgi:hypothetical protein